MVPQRIAEIQARLNAATPGPWEECCPEWPCANIAARGVNVATAYSGRGDVAFIAAAPEDMRYLLERVAALETALAPFGHLGAKWEAAIAAEPLAAVVPTLGDSRLMFRLALTPNGVQEMTFTVGDLRRARSVLAGLPHGQEQPQK